MTELALIENPARTENQTRAIEERGKNFVVVAGAGAGKTRVLVERYLSLLDEGQALPSIVAITFTEKAAREMRDRVRGEIERRAASDPRWDGYRREIDAAQISTIHSLCARLLRANPAEAQVDPRFEMLEETDAAILQDEAIGAVLADLAETGGPALAPLTEYEIETVRGTLAQLFQTGAAVDEAFARLPEGLDALPAQWQAQLERAQREALTRLLNSADWRDAAAWVHGNSANDPDDRLERVRVEFLRCLNDLEGHPLEALRRIGDTAIRSVGRKAAWDDIVAAKGALFALRALARDFRDTYDLTLGDDDRRAAALVFLWREVWMRARREYSARKTERRVLDYDDLEERARALLRDHPDVRVRYRAEFSCVLVDEFQDTNAAQRDVVYALASPEEPDRLFVVADGKQSIYGFRGADVSVFSGTRNDIQARWGSDAIIPLAESFRAHTRLVRAFNHLFARVFAVEGTPAPYEIAYEPMTCPRASPDREPLIEIVEIPKGDEGTTGGQREREAEELAARLNKIVAEEFQVWDKEKRAYRGAQWGDIALLFRATTHFTTYEDALKAAAVPYVTFAGKGYYDRAEVRDLIHLLRALDDPSDDLAIATVLRSPLYALSDETLYRLRREGRPFRETLSAIPDDLAGDERARVEFAGKSLQNLWGRVRRVPILDLLKGALEDTDYLATLTGLSDGRRRRGNVEKLLALARRTGLVRLSEFNAHLRDLSGTEVREGEAVVEGRDAVKLMSIHRAKGLEFPIVVIPEAARTPREGGGTLLADRDMGVGVAVRDGRGKSVKPVGYRLLKIEASRREEAEEKRLLYVAATRAQEYLIVSGAKEAPEKSYLRQILDALGGETRFDWGSVEIREPGVEFGARARGVQPTAQRDAAAAADSTRAELPMLATPLAPPTVRTLRSFTPTGLETLVRDCDEFDRRYLEGAPERVMPVTRETERARAPAYVVGEMAHRAIKRWRFPDATPDIEQILAGYAHERGLTDAEEIHAAVREAARLLRKFAASDLHREMGEAAERRHEVPFVVQWDGRILHGEIDAIYRRADGDWVIADFKTDRLREGRDAREFTLEKYGVQLALYRQAASMQFGDARVRVYYVEDAVPVDLDAADLAPALERARTAASE